MQRRQPRMDSRRYSATPRVRICLRPSKITQAVAPMPTQVITENNTMRAATRSCPYSMAVITTTHRIARAALRHTCGCSPKNCRTPT